MSDSLTLLAPAKLNLFLHVTGRRPDGYHNLQTLFQLLDFGDKLTFSANDSGNVTLSGEVPGLATEDNIILRAAERLQSGNLGAVIELEKHIPTGGGLGGGSSDAAATLLALNQLWQAGHSSEELASIGRELGADVPVFVMGRSAWAEGIGEILTPLELPECWYLVISPNCHVSTAEIFSHDQLTRNSAGIKMAAFFHGDSRNDCQDLVRRLYPEVDKALIFLDNFGEARLTGTGSSVFASFDSEAQAEAAGAQVPDIWTSFVARGINRSPAATALS